MKKTTFVLMAALAISFLSANSEFRCEPGPVEPVDLCADVICDDDNELTDDTCDNGICVFELLADCDTDIDCANDNEVCITHETGAMFCALTSGGCRDEYTGDDVPEGTTCDDVNPDTAEDVCDAHGNCAGALRCDFNNEDEVCDDGNECTEDFCSPVTYTCVHEALVNELSYPCQGGVCYDGQCLVIGEDCVNPVTSEDVANGIRCDDGDAYTIGDECHNGTCRGVETECLNDDNCTDDGFCWRRHEHNGSYTGVCVWDYGICSDEALEDDSHCDDLGSGNDQYYLVCKPNIAGVLHLVGHTCADEMACQDNEDFTSMTCVAP